MDCSPVLKYTSGAAMTGPDADVLIAVLLLPGLILSLGAGAVRTYSYRA